MFFIIDADQEYSKIENVDGLDISYTESAINEQIDDENEAWPDEKEVGRVDQPAIIENVIFDIVIQGKFSYFIDHHE